MDFEKKKNGRTDGNRNSGRIVHTLMRINGLVGHVRAQCTIITQRVLMGPNLTKSSPLKRYRTTTMTDRVTRRSPAARVSSIVATVFIKLYYYYK